MELTTKAEPILGKFKGLRRLLWQLILALDSIRTMLDLPFIDPKQMDDIDSGLFITFGRALYVAQHFEANCRALATLLDVRDAHRSGKISPSNEDPDFNKFVDKLWKRLLAQNIGCLLYTSPSPRDRQRSRMPSSA